MKRGTQKNIKKNFTKNDSFRNKQKKNPIRLTAYRDEIK